MNRWLGERIAWLDASRTGHRLILRLLPRAIALRFDRAAASDLEATLELAIRHPTGPASYALTIAQAACVVQPGAPAQSAARAEIASADLIRLASGSVGWPELMSSGRFALTGDPFVGLRFAALFRLPVALDPA